MMIALLAHQRRQEWMNGLSTHEREEYRQRQRQRRREWWNALSDDEREMYLRRQRQHQRR